MVKLAQAALVPGGGHSARTIGTANAVYTGEHNTEQPCGEQGQEEHTPGQANREQRLGEEEEATPDSETSSDVSSLNSAWMGHMGLGHRRSSCLVSFQVTAIGELLPFRAHVCLRVYKFSTPLCVNKNADCRHQLLSAKRTPATSCPVSDVLFLLTLIT